MSNRWAQGMPYGTSAIPYIGENGNWWVNQEDTGVKAQGPEGKQGQRGEAGIGAPGPALQYEDLTEEQKLELVSHYTADMQAVKDSTIAETNEMLTEAKAEMDATKAATLTEAKTIAEDTTAAIVNNAVEAAQAEIDASVATATENINAAATNAENAKVRAEEAANSATATLESMKNIKQEAIDAASEAAAETASSTVDAAVAAAQEQINENINTAKDIAVAAANNADASKIAANEYANAAATSASAAATSANSAVSAKNSAEAAAASATEDRNAIGDAATLAESYAKGGTGTREGEDEDNAKHFYTLCKAIAESNGSSFLGDCLYSALPADAPIGTIYRIITDEGTGFGADLNDEAAWAEFEEAMANVTTLYEQYALMTRMLFNMYDAGSLFIKTASGWEPFTQNLNDQLLTIMCDFASKIDGLGGEGAVKPPLETIGYAKISDMSELRDNIFADNCAGVNVTDGSYTFTQEAASYTINVAKAHTDGGNTVGECVLTNSLNLRSGNVYTIVPLVDYNTLNILRVTLVNTADNTVILNLNKYDFVYAKSISLGTSFKSLSLDKDVVAKVILHVEDSSVSEDGATINLGIFDYAVPATLFLTVDNRLNALLTRANLASDAIAEIGSVVGYFSVGNLITLPYQATFYPNTVEGRGTVRIEEDGTVVAESNSTSEQGSTYFITRVTLDAGIYALASDCETLLAKNLSVGVTLSDDTTGETIVTQLNTAGPVEFTLTETRTVQVKVWLPFYLNYVTKVKPYLIEGGIAYLPLRLQQKPLFVVQDLKFGPLTLNAGSSNELSESPTVPDGYALLDFNAYCELYTEEYNLSVLGAKAVANVVRLDPLKIVVIAANTYTSTIKFSPHVKLVFIRKDALGYNDILANTRYS